MEKNNNHDKYFRELLSGRRKEMPFSDFEDELMTEIRREHARNNSQVKNIKLSWIFFFLGMVAGIVLVIISPVLSEGSAVVDENFIYAGIVFICLFILLFAEKLYTISFRRNN
ncbi:MAG: hypothetical protein RQ743_13870 [Bacteroidales bacterium]|nr:hypothetical protein [Bacteroidales bacterium]